MRQGKWFLFQGDRKRDLGCDEGNMKIFILGEWEKRFLYLGDRKRNFSFWETGKEIFFGDGQQTFLFMWDRKSCFLCFFLLGRRGKRFLVLGKHKKRFFFLGDREKIFALWGRKNIAQVQREEKNHYFFIIQYHITRI